MPETTNNSELFDLLMNIRKNEAQMENFVKKLEGNIPNRGEDVADFYKRYTIFVLEKYCHSLDDRELMLAACGLLRGDSFHDKNMEDRIVAYWEYSRSYNKLFEDIKTKQSAIRTSSKHMNRIIGYMTEELLVDMNMNNGKLGLVNKVPNKLELYSPRVGNGIHSTIANKESENKRPEDGSKNKSENKEPGNCPSEGTVPESNPINTQTNKDGTGLGESELKDSMVKDTQKRRHRKKRKVDTSAKTGSVATAGASSHVSVQIINVVGKQEDPNKEKRRIRNKGISKRIILGVIIGIIILVVLFIVIPTVIQMAANKNIPAVSVDAAQSEQELLRLEMEIINREIGGNTINDAKATFELSFTDSDTGKKFTYTKTISLEQNTDELEEPIDENIN